MGKILKRSCVSHKHLFPRDVTEGHTWCFPWYLSCCSILPGNKKKLWKQIPSYTTSQLTVIYQPPHTAQWTNFFGKKKWHFRTHPESKPILLMPKTQTCCPLNPLTKSFSFPLKSCSKTNISLHWPGLETYLRFTNVHFVSFSIHGWEDFLWHPCWKCLNTFHWARRLPESSMATPGQAVHCLASGKL